MLGGALPVPSCSHSPPSSVSATGDATSPSRVLPGNPSLPSGSRKPECFIRLIAANEVGAERKQLPHNSGRSANSTAVLCPHRVSPRPEKQPGSSGDMGWHP